MEISFLTFLPYLVFAVIFAFTALVSIDAYLKTRENSFLLLFLFGLLYAISYVINAYWRYYISLVSGGHMAPNMFFIAMLSMVASSLRILGAILLVVSIFLLRDRLYSLV